MWLELKFVSFNLYSEKRIKSTYPIIRDADENPVPVTHTPS
jgi:hypothetical protein